MVVAVSQYPVISSDGHDTCANAVLLCICVLKAFYEDYNKKAIYGDYESKYLALKEDLITMKKFSKQVSKQSQTCLEHIKNHIIQALSNFLLI